MRQIQKSKVKNQKHSSKVKSKNIFLNINHYLCPIYKYKIAGKSMHPVLHDEDGVLVNRVAYLFGSPKIGDIVVAREPRDGKIIIKRVIKIENSKYHIEGDNKTASTDSRDFGLIDKDDIIGKVIFVL